MNYFLAFFPPQEANFKIRKVVGELGRVFDGQQIDVRWVKPENFHVSTIFLGTDISFLKRKSIEMKLSKFQIPNFVIKFDKAQLGISRQYKELVYITVSDGGDELRDLVFTLRETLGINDPGRYIPHVTLGRINKDLTDEEFKNLTQDVRNINKGLEISKVSFVPHRLALVESDGQEYKILKEF